MNGSYPKRSVSSELNRHSGSSVHHLVPTRLLVVPLPPDRTTDLRVSPSTQKSTTYTPIGDNPRIVLSAATPDSTSRPLPVPIAKARAMANTFRKALHDIQDRRGITVLTGSQELSRTIFLGLPLGMPVTSGLLKPTCQEIQDLLQVPPSKGKVSQVSIRESQNYSLWFLLSSTTFPPISHEDKRLG